MCCMSRQVKSGLASRTRAIIAEAMGELALVPVNDDVQPLFRSVVIIFLSNADPELYVVASVAEHASEYQGTRPSSVVLDTVMV